MQYHSEMLSLVTGGAGFIGRHLVRKLLSARPGTVRAFDNLHRGTFADPVGERLECITGDIRNSGDLQRAMQGCDVVFHLAAEASVMGCELRPGDAHDVNVTGTYNVLRAAREMGVRRVVIASSREVYGEVSALPVHESTPMKPKNLYGTTKAAAEIYAGWASSMLEISVLRLANVFGPGDTDRVIPRFLAAAASNRPLTVYGGAQVIDFICVHRVVDAFVRAGFHSFIPGPVNIGSGRGMTVLEAATRVIDLLRSTSELKLLPARDAEVSKFVADVGRMNHELGVWPSEDPLASLGDLCFPDVRGCTQAATIHC